MAQACRSSGVESPQASRSSGVKVFRLRHAWAPLDDALTPSAHTATGPRPCSGHRLRHGLSTIPWLRLAPREQSATTTAVGAAFRRAPQHTMRAGEAAACAEAHGDALDASRAPGRNLCAAARRRYERTMTYSHAQRWARRMIMAGSAVRCWRASAAPAHTER